MKQFSDKSSSALIDMLAIQTIFYTQMLADNVKTNDFYKCKRLIEQLTYEIELRKRADQSANPAISTIVPFNEE